MLIDLLKRLSSSIYRTVLYNCSLACPSFIYLIFLLTHTILYFISFVQTFNNNYDLLTYDTYMHTYIHNSRMECSVCSHTWFQSRERIADLGEGFEMIPLPERDMERIQTNMKEGRHPKYMGDFKVYVGNISFQCTEADLFELFETVGPVGDVSMVRDEVGRIRGFGFITMMKKADGEKALEELDGVELKGRNLNVRPSTS